MIRLYSKFFLILGFISVGLGIAGAFLPLLPATPFFLLASWCFVRSSERAHAWLHRQPLIGKALDDWERTHSISKKNKSIAVGTILISAIFIIFRPVILPFKITLILILASVILFLVTRPSK